MPAHHLRKSIRRSVGVVWLERDQRGCADDEVVEIDLMHVLRKSGSGIGDNSKCIDTGDETERGEGCLATRRVVQVSRGAEERHARLIHGAGSESLGVADDKFLGTSRGLRGKARGLGS